MISGDSPVSISKAMGLTQISFAEAYSELEPSLIVALGDRFEMMAAVGG